MNPDQYTLGEHFLDVGDGHTLYVHDWGTKDARLPILYLHGGPGAATHDGQKILFDPTRQRVIFFDQRGCGKSLPAGSVEHNTTKELIEDIETIAVKLGLDKFIITGGSWGSCLALAYALKYPKRVDSMVLRGIYTGSHAETAYLDNGDVWKHYFPDVWQAYLDRTPKAHHHNPTPFHQKQAAGDDPVKAKQSIYAYAELESSLLKLDDRHVPEDYETFDPNSMKIELHFLSNQCFMPDRYIFDNAHKLKMPIWLVQGRYDMVCAPQVAYELHQALPNSHLVWTIAGHSGSERATQDAMGPLLEQLAG